jgi:hypothetical protein
MKSIFHLKLSIFLMLSSVTTFAQIGIGTTSPAPSAALEITSLNNNKGILIPRLTDTQKNGISNPSEGLLIFQTSAPSGFYFFTNGAWKLMLSEITGKDLSSNDYTTAEKTKLAAIIGTNTGDQDLSSLATIASVALKANTSDLTSGLATKVDKVGGKDLSTNDYTTAEKTKLAAIMGANTGDQDISSLATIASVALKANTSDLTSGLATKVDKFDGKELSTNDYTTAEKTKLAAISGINTGDQTTITGNAGTATKLAASKNINGVAFDGSADITVTAAAETLTGTTLNSTVTGSSLTSVGTIGTGTWNGTVIDVIHGGTGTNNGSITGTSALTFTAGSTNQNISIKPSGTGSVIVGNGTTSPTSSAALDVSSTTQGFLPPRMTTAQRDSITSPVEGLTIWNTTNSQLEVHDGSYWKNMVGLLVSPLRVGDTYGGGKVFYIFGSSDNGYIKGQTHGLIAATEDQTTNAGVKWFPDKFYGATGTYIGLGLPNTLAIITSAVVTGTTNMSSFAAGLANSYRGGGYSDWFLPSKDELNLLYQNRDAVGGFATTGHPTYWSSTQKGGISFTNFTSFANGVTSARTQFFFTTTGADGKVEGTQSDLGIDNPRRVRAIRIF